MDEILDVMEDIKQNITDNQYKTIMESLMEVDKSNKKLLAINKPNKFVCLINWIDSKIEITNNKDDKIGRLALQKYIIVNYFDDRYFENIDFLKEILKIYFEKSSTKDQFHNFQYEYVKFRN